MYFLAGEERVSQEIVCASKQPTIPPASDNNLSTRALHTMQCYAGPVNMAC